MEFEGNKMSAVLRPNSVIFDMTIAMTPSMNAFPLNNLDQTMLRIYVRHLHLFEFPDAQYTDNAFKALRKGLQETLYQLPFLAGSIYPSAEQTSRLSLKYHESIAEEEVDRILTCDIKDSKVNDYGLQFDILDAEGFPPSKLSRETFCPQLLKNHPGLDDVYAEGLISFKKGQAVPVFAAQANFIHGGLILSVYLNHNVVDGTGIAQIYRIWSSHLLSASHLKTPTLSPQLGHKADSMEIMEAQRHALDELARSSKAKDCPEVRYPGTKPSTPTLRSTPYKLSAKLLVFSSSTIQKLTSELASITNLRISSFTTLVSLLWMHISLAREANLKEKHIQNTKLAMAFDHRKNLKQYISDSYLGNCATGITASSPLSAMLPYTSDPVTAEHLAPIAQRIADTLSSITLDWLKPRLSLFARTPNPHHLGLDIDIVNGPDLFVTSWMHISTDCNWHIPGVTGQKPKAIRKPQSQVEGNIHILPRLKPSTTDPPFEVMVCLEEEEMERCIKRLDNEKWAEKIISA